MNQILQIGQTVRTDSGFDCSVEQFLGGGGQGEVYRAGLSGGQVALKWYFPHYLESDPSQELRLRKAIDKGSPSDRFLWPTELVYSNDTRGFGYIMELREPRFRGIADLMSRRIEPSFKSLSWAGYELAESYFKLHAPGLCYRDISFGNVFFDPDSGEVRICDNDNVDIDGTDSGILGTPRFMAPEIVRGEELPGIESDRFSLAVLLFYMLMTHHPLEGAREHRIHALDLPAMRKLYGTNPIFIYDPDDDSNRPVPGYQDNAIIFWKIYPEFLKSRFTDAFTAGLRDPKNGRVVETQWRGDMIRLHDSVYHCPSCGKQVFYDPIRLKANGKLDPCWGCGAEQRLPWRIRLNNGSLKTFVGTDIVALDHDTKLYPHHVDEGESFDFSTPIAEVSQHPKKPDLLGLKNLSGGRWICHTEDGTLREVEPGRSFAMKNGARINFGKVEGAIRR